MEVLKCPALLGPQEGVSVDDGDNYVAELSRCLQRADVAWVDRVVPAAGCNDPAAGPDGVEILEGHDRRAEMFHSLMVATMRV